MIDIFERACLALLLVNVFIVKMLSPIVLLLQTFLYEYIKMVLLVFFYFFL